MRIVAGSAGSFLCPPGHPMLLWHIETGRKANPNLIASLEYALDPDNADVPEGIRRKVEALYAQATLVRSEMWERHIYGYFRNCYSADGNRNASTRQGPPEHHEGYLTVRHYFPDAEPRLDLIASGGRYGTWPCVKCGKGIQYESKVDRYAEAFTCEVACPRGGDHEIQETT